MNQMLKDYIDGLRAKLIGSTQHWRLVVDILKESGPRLAMVVFFLTLLEAAVSLGSLYAIKLLIDAIGAGLISPSSQGAIYQSLALTGGLLLGVVIIQSVTNLAKTRQALLVSDVVDRRIHTKAIEVDYGFYESPLYFDTLQRAREAGSQRPAQVLSTLIGLVRSAIMLVAILAMLIAIEWRLIPVILVTVSVALGVRLYYTRKSFEWRMARSQAERKAGYFDYLLTADRTAKEMRINRLGSYFQGLYSGIRATIRGEHLALDKDRLTAEVCVSILSTSVFLGASAYLIHNALTGQITIGEVAMFILLLRRAEGSGNELVGSVTRVVDDHQYLGRLALFLDLQPSMRADKNALSVPTPIKSGVTFENVSFTYPGSESKALDNVSLFLPFGQVIALVGENGSGKTTLIKLLCRLFDPTEGRILLDGIDIRQFDPDNYRQILSIIFQEYGCYAATVGENIAFGNVDRLQETESIRQAAVHARADQFIDALPGRYDTLLSKVFDTGTDISVGQWQRLALARAFFPQSQFIILDEPTSAVDAMAEYELFDGFAERIAGRGALLISHRLSTVRMASYTYVLEGGRITEQGTHTSLMNQSGRYALLFSRQAENYKF